MESAPARIKDGLYRQIVDTIPVFTVDVLFFNPERTQTLLFKRVNEPARGQYYSLGGRVLKNEEPIDAAIRKVREEIGLEIYSNQLFFGGIISETFPTSAFEGVSAHNINAHWGCIWDDNQLIELDSQHVQYDWFDVNDQSLHPLVSKRISNLLKHD